MWSGAGIKKKEFMKLFLISQTVNTKYDTYDSAVVCAATEEDAIKIPPGDPAYYQSPIDVWCQEKDVKVKFIGEAAPEMEVGVICASFNAG